MKIQTIDPKELPYYDRLNAVRQVIDKIDKNTGRYDVRGPCVKASKLAAAFIPGLEVAGGIYVPLCHGHAFNYDPEIKIYIDLTMDQFDFMLKSKWDNEKKLAEWRTKKKKDMIPEELAEFERKDRLAKTKGRAGYLLGDFQLQESDKPKNLLKYQKAEDMPYTNIPKIVAVSENNPLLKEYAILTRRLINKDMQLEELIAESESRLNASLKQ